MHNSYFHHCANCLVVGAKPLPYVQWLTIVNQLEVTPCAVI
jgi:hypothetical protein